MFGHQIGFNPQAGLPQVPQGQPTPQKTQTGVVQPSVGPMSSMDTPPMTPNQMMTPMPMSQRIAGLQDRMELATPMAGPQATEDAFPMDKIMAGFGGGFGQLPTAGQVDEQMPEVRQNILEQGEKKKSFTKSELKTLLQPLDKEQAIKFLDGILANGYEVVEEEVGPTKFDEARGKVDNLFEGAKPVKIGGVTVADPMKPMIAAASAGIDIAEGISEAYNRRQKKIDEIIMDQARGDISGERATLRAIGQSMGLGGDIVGEGFMAGLKTLDSAMGGAGSSLISKIGETQAAKEGLVLLGEGLDKYNEWADQNPQLAKDIDATLGAADFLLNFVGVGITGKGVRQARNATQARALENITKRTPLAQVQEVAKIANAIDGKVSFIDKAISNVSKINPETANTLRKNKGLIVYGDAKGWNTETVSQGVLDTLQKNMDRFSEAGEAYTAIRESGQQIDMTPIKQRVIKALEKDGISVSNGQLVFPKGLTKYDSADQRLIKEAVERFLQEGDKVDVNAFLDGRMLLSKQARFDANVTKSKDATDYIQRLRGEISDEAKKQVSGLKEADNVYAGINDSIDGLLREFYSSQGTQKGNVTNKIKQIMKRLDSDPQKKTLLRVVPDIDDKLKYLDVMDDLAKSQGNKAFTYMASTLPIGGFIAGGPIGGGLGFLASTYFAGGDVLKSLLLKFGSGGEDMAKQIARKVSKQQKLLDNEQKIIQDAIQKAKEAVELPALPSPTATPIPAGGFPQQGQVISPMGRGPRQVIEGPLPSPTSTPVDNAIVSENINISKFIEKTKQNSNLSKELKDTNIGRINKISEQIQSADTPQKLKEILASIHLGNDGYFFKGLIKDMELLDIFENMPIHKFDYEIPQDIYTKIKKVFTPVDDLPRPSDLKATQPSAMLKAPDEIQQFIKENNPAGDIYDKTGLFPDESKFIKISKDELQKVQDYIVSIANEADDILDLLSTTGPLREDVRIMIIDNIQKKGKGGWHSIARQLREEANK